MTFVLALAACLHQAATPQPADAPHVIHVGRVAPDILEVTVVARRVVHGQLVPYEAQPGDKIDNPEKDRWVTRDGKPLGALAGADQKLVYTFDTVVGQPLDTAWADRSTSFRLASADDPGYAQPRSPAQVWRKSFPTDFARTGPWAWDASAEHRLYLKLDAPLREGATYTLSFEGDGLEVQQFRCDSAALRSEAVHVDQLGFRPDDPVKQAFLSCWLGSGGKLSYPLDTTFQVVEVATGKPAFEGTIALSKAADDLTEDAYKQNHNKTDVHVLDFSGLNQPGTYRVVVDGVGCSFPFPIADDVWLKAFFVSARGFYHQRSGIALGPPYTDFKRPRSFHPDDGLQVYQSTTPLMDSGNGLSRDDQGNFGHLNAGRTDQLVGPNAWGGYMDAGDWDRRIQHLIVSRLLLELVELFPGTYDTFSLNLPESNNDLPDVVDEALWGLDVFRRLQMPDGGIRGGIESSEHPRYGEASWQESLTVMAYAPGVWSSYVYAGVAARAARLLEPRDPALAKTYRDSALAAMQWAEAELPNRADRKDPHEVHDARNLAAAELYRLTGDAAWHQLFLATTQFSDPKAELAVWQHHEQREAAWVYLRTDRPEMDATIEANCRAALLREADDRAAWTGRTGFRWTKDPWRPVGWGILAAPDAVGLARAHVLTGDAKYLRAAVSTCQTGAGANPLNLCYTTGLGQRSPQHPLHLDSQRTGQPPPPGLTIFGPIDAQREKDTWAMKIVRRWLYPEIEAWPDLEAYFDVFWYPAMCEFTVQQPMAENAYVWGYLAGRK